MFTSRGLQSEFFALRVDSVELWQFCESDTGIPSRIWNPKALRLSELLYPREVILQSVRKS